MSEITSDLGRSNAYDILNERGFLHQSTDSEAIRRLFAEESVVAYVGLDPTADSLHVGHLVTLMALWHLERAGHRPIVVLGGGTALVGDPSGKSEMRRMLSRETIDAHGKVIAKQVGGLLTIGELTRVVDNTEWLLDLNYIEFLRTIGRYFSVNRMLSAEAYRLRLEKGLSFLEFNYQLLQAYDFLELNRRYGCTLQLGGDDQWGNILAGVDLIRRVERKTVHGLTFPLLVTATGTKMGKTADGAVWLARERFSDFDYYQYWVNTHDDDVIRALGIFTVLPMAEIAAVAGLDTGSLNAAKSVLAYEATAMLRGRDAADRAHRAALGAFGTRTLPEDILPSSAVPRKVSGDADAIPSSVVPIRESYSVVDLLVLGGLASSKSAARRLIEQGAVRVNGERIVDVHAQVTCDTIAQETLTLRAGKKKVHRFRLDRES